MLSDRDLCARQADRLERGIERLPGAADERAPRRVLLRAGRLTDQQHPRPGRVVADDHVRARRGEFGAGRAAARPASASASHSLTDLHESRHCSLRSSRNAP